MKTTILSKLFIVSFLLFFFSFSVLVLGDQGGRTGRTLKTSTTGCSCHGSNTAGVSAVITGPDTVIAGQTVQYTFTVTYAGKIGMGLDIATRLGTLGVVSNTTHISNGELTHNDNILMTNGTAAITFNYTAPASSGFDTLWANGIATNSQSNTSGDNWTWATSKRVTVRTTTGIEPVISPAEFKIIGNYPNPFNPSTKIEVSLMKPANVNIKIFDINGEEVYNMINSRLSEGNHVFEWNSVNDQGTAVNSGVYFMRIDVGGLIEAKKMMLVK